MIDQVEYYQFGFYAPNTHLEPEPDIIGRLLEAFKSKGFIPTTIQEVGISTAGQAPSSRLQLQFTSPNREWNVAFEPNRVLLKKANVMSDTGIGSPDDFLKEAIVIFNSLLGAHPFIGTRLTYVMKGLLPEMTAAKLIEANNRVINLLPFYTEHPPHQWTTRNVARVDVNLGDDTETLNVITDINRIQGELMKGTEPLPIDRIQIGFDINTYQGNTDLRFNAEHVKLFLDVAITKSQDIMDEIGGKLNG